MALLIDYFLKEFATAHSKTVKTVTPAVRKAFQSYSWPGNVRELRNVVESMVVIDSDGVLDVDDLTDDLLGASPAPTDGSTGGASHLIGHSLEDIEKYYISETLKQTKGNREEAARLLGIGERTLYRKLKEYEIN